MRVFIQRTIWFAIWIAAMTLIMLVSWDMARDQPVLLYAITLAMIVMSLGFVYSRQHFNEGNKGSATAALTVGLLALAVIVVSEVSYWSSSIEGIHEQVVREKAGAAGVDLVKERRRQQLAKATSGKIPAEIRVEIANARDQAEARKLRAQLAAAEELEKLQGQVIADSTEVVNYSIKRSFYDAARLGSENIGGSIAAWITGITLLIVTFILSLDAFALLIAFAPQRGKEARGAAKAVPAPTVPTIIVPPAATPPEAFVKPQDPEPVKSPPPEQPKPPKKEEAPVAQRPVLSLVDNNPLKPRSKEERNEAVDVITKRWMEAEKVSKAPLSLGQAAVTLYESYAAWCHTARVSPISDSHFGRSVRRLGIATGRDVNGAKYGLKLAEKKSAVA